MNPYTFVVGCPRSGTTLLGRLGDAHPDLAVIHETRWIASFFEERTGLTPDGSVTPELLVRLQEHARWEKLGIEPAEVEPALHDGGEPVPYARFVSALFDLYGRKHGKRLVGDKTPRYVRSLPTLSRLWPEAKMVHLIRDGRDVCLSVLDWRKGAPRFSSWEQDPVSTAALWWEWHVLLGREAGMALGPERYYELCYESLVAEPERECTALCEFLGIPYDGAMLRFHVDKERDDPELDAKKAWRPVTGGLRSWRSELPAEDVERFEAAVGGLLDQLGYERGAAAPPAGRLVDDAARLRASFAAQVRARGRSLPGDREPVS